VKYQIENEKDLQWARETYAKAFEATLFASHTIRNLRKTIIGLREAAQQAGDGVLADKFLSHAAALEQAHNALVADYRDIESKNTDLYLSIYVYERGKEDGNDKQMGSDSGSYQGGGKADDAGGKVVPLAVRKETPDSTVDDR